MADDQNNANPASAGHAEGDRELAAMNAIVNSLKPLKEAERRNVLEYVLRRFGAVPIQTQLATPVTPSPTGIEAPSTYPGSGSIKDIRTLREEKAPKSANEMAALVAYYVSELAPATERKPEINKIDIERYFKNAGFRLTANAGQTLVNAKNAGYLDAGSDTGYYRLNPVGYNLVVHRLAPGDGKHPRRSRKAAAKRKAASRPKH